MKNKELGIQPTGDKVLVKAVLGNIMSVNARKGVVLARGPKVSAEIEINSEVVFFWNKETKSRTYYYDDNCDLLILPQSLIQAKVVE